MKVNIDTTIAELVSGAIIAYPTEAVFGLGCDARNEKAVNRLIALKQRAASKGLIVLISDYQQLYDLVGPIDAEIKQTLEKHWPGHTTFIFPKSTKTPAWLCGSHNSIAIRMSQHPIASKLCRDFPITSTSANLSGEEAARSIDTVKAVFKERIDNYIDAPLGGQANPSRIIDIQSGQILR